MLKFKGKFKNVNKELFTIETVDKQVITVEKDDRFKNIAAVLCNGEEIHVSGMFGQSEAQGGAMVFKPEEIYVKVESAN